MKLLNIATAGIDEANPITTAAWTASQVAWTLHIDLKEVLGTYSMSTFFTNYVLSIIYTVYHFTG